MKSAWALFNKGAFTFADAMRMAWKSVKLRIRMKSGVVRFAFIKIDGTIRQAVGTLMSDVLPVSAGVQRRENYTVQIYFDMEKGQYRSYSIANLL